MIVTVTPSPSLDLTYVLPTALDPETEVHRARTSSIEASGKGVNVSRALARVGVPTIAVLPVAGATGRQLLDLLDADGVQHRAVEQSGMTRVNTSVLQPGRTTKVNAPARPATIAETDMLVAAAAGALAHAREADPGSAHWLAVCGSLAGGRAEDVLRRLVATAHAAGARCAVDTSSGALAAAVRAGADLLSPNAVELADLVGPDQAFATGDGVDPGIAADAAAGVARATGGQVLVSLGPQGAVWTDGVEARHAAGPADRAAEHHGRRRRAARRLARRAGGRGAVVRGERRAGRAAAGPRRRLGRRHVPEPGHGGPAGDAGRGRRPRRGRGDGEVREAERLTPAERRWPRITIGITMDG